MGPVVTPAGTTAVICVEEFRLNAADSPLNVTLAFEKLVPMMTTLVPARPFVGEKLVITGGR